METVTRKPFTVSGRRITTQAQAETQPETAQIGPLWQRVFQELKTPPELAYGVYTAYEDREFAHYDVLAGLAGDYPLEDADSLTIPGGTYLKFETSMTEDSVCQACMQLWQEVWTFFQRTGAPERCYDCDFEEYSQQGKQLAIYIGIKGK